MRALLPVLTVVMALLALWYIACVPMNVREVLTQAEREGAVIVPESATERRDASAFTLVWTNRAHLGAAWSVERAKLPSPHQVAVEIWDSTVGEEVYGRRGIVQSGSFSNRSLVYHTGITLWATVLGFVIGTGLGIGLAIGIVHSRTMDMSVMPWAIVSQTIPIVALAPMIIVVLYSVGLSGLVAKAVTVRLAKSPAACPPIPSETAQSPSSGRERMESSLMLRTWPLWVRAHCDRRGASVLGLILRPLRIACAAGLPRPIPERRCRRSQRPDRGPRAGQHR